MRQLSILVLTLLCSWSVSAQEFADLDKSSLDAVYYPARAAFRAFAKTDSAATALDPQIRILYSRPFKKGREVWGGDLAPYGEPYRLGANETTEITFYGPVMIGDRLVPAGRYTIGAIPNADSFEVFFSVDVDGWGVYAYQPEHSVANVTVPTSQVDEVIENFSITLYEASKNIVHLKMGWDKTVVEVPITLVQ